MPKPDNIQSVELQEILDAYPRFITYPQAAEITSASVRTLKRLSADGQLPTYRVGRTRTLRLKTTDVVALVERVM